MEYNLYRISSGTLAGIAVVFLGAIALGLFLRRRAELPLWRSIWVALSMASAASVLLITLAPSGYGGTYPCEYSLSGSLFGWLHGNQSTANVAMLVPVSVAFPVATRGSRWYPWSFVMLLAFPVLIEALQATVPVGRACDAADVIDNWFGVVIGCLLGWVGLAGMRRLTGRASATR